MRACPLGVVWLGPSPVSELARADQSAGGAPGQYCRTSPSPLAVNDHSFAAPSACPSPLLRMNPRSRRRAKSFEI